MYGASWARESDNSDHALLGGRLKYFVLLYCQYKVMFPQKQLVCHLVSLPTVKVNTSASQNCQNI